MQYKIKAIPTTYSGVVFRSRLEAMWAAFFDQCGWKWVYEPFDLDGWAPDFKLTIRGKVVLVEVKPVDSGCDDIAELEAAFSKACKHAYDHYVALLCDGPRGPVVGIPIYREDPPDELVEVLTVAAHEALWREAGNRTQWQPQGDSKQESSAHLVDYSPILVAKLIENSRAKRVAA